MKTLFSKSTFDITRFTPTSKVHVQRDVMRDVDSRLAKYSRRGILLSVIVFTLALSMGEYYKQYPSMTLFLAGGLIIITFIRACFLIRFESRYAQGPARWRQHFFILSLLGSTWWGVIVACVTWGNGLLYETPILWLYTVAFFAGSIYVYAPFQRFLKVYMLASFIPCALVAIYQFEAISVLYGFIMIALYVLLCRQGSFIGQNFWDKLQANYDLLKRAKTLEAEKITTESSLNNRDVLFNNLTQEFKSSLQEILGSLQLLKDSDLPDDYEQLVLLSEQKAQQQISLLRNATELSNITHNKIMLEHDIIDPRYHIEQALSYVSLIVHKKSIELFSSFSDDFPLRLHGDAERLEQIMGNLVTSASQFCELGKKGELIVSASFREKNDSGALKISILNANPLRTTEAEASINAAFSPHYATDVKLGLSLAIVKGLAGAMRGSAGVYFNDDGSLIFWASIYLKTTTTGQQRVEVPSKISGKKVLVYQTPTNIADTFHHTLDTWGLNVDMVNDEAQAIQILESSVEKLPYHLVLIYTHLNSVEGLKLSKAIAEHKVLWATPQIIILSQIQSKVKSVEEHFLTYVNLDVVYKPIQYRKLKKRINDSLLDHKKEASKNKVQDNILKDKHLLLFQEEDIDTAIMKSTLKKVGCHVTVATHLDQCIEFLSKDRFDAFICESHLENNNLQAFIELAKQAVLKVSPYKMPILGVSSHEQECEASHCLALGMDCYIDTPVNIDDLEAILKRFIGRAIHLTELNKNTSK
jgi:signal transduction histidine kinase/DNA-binding response OmpR family regulator